MREVRGTDIWLLIIDMPDERTSDKRGRYDHMHAWGTKTEMEILARRLRDSFGGKHMVTDSAICPHCGAHP